MYVSIQLVHSFARFPPSPPHCATFARAREAAEMKSSAEQTSTTVYSITYTPTCRRVFETLNPDWQPQKADGCVGCSLVLARERPCAVGFSSRGAGRWARGRAGGGRRNGGGEGISSQPRFCIARGITRVFHVFIVLCYSTTLLYSTLLYFTLLYTAFSTPARYVATATDASSSAATTPTYPSGRTTASAPRAASTPHVRYASPL